MTKIAENIKKLMELEGINPAELSAKTGIERSTLHRILDGSTKNPTIESIKTIIKHYSFDEVVYGISPSAKHDKNEIPILSWMEATVPLSNINFSKKKMIKINIKASKNSFALILEHKLDSHFPKGALIVIDADRSPKDRSFVIVREKEGSLPSVKRYIIDGSTIYLKSMDQSLPSIKYEPDRFKIIGVIIQSIFDFEE